MEQANINFILLFLLTLNIICVSILIVAVLRLYIKQQAAELSTHRLEFMPVNLDMTNSDKEEAALNEELAEELPDFNDFERKSKRRDLI